MLANKQHIHKLSVAKMRMLKWISGKTMRDRLRNEYIWEHLGVALVGDKLRETRLRLF